MYVRVGICGRAGTPSYKVRAMWLFAPSPVWRMQNSIILAHLILHSEASPLCEKCVVLRTSPNFNVQYPATCNLIRMCSALQTISTPVWLHFKSSALGLKCRAPTACPSSENMPAKPSSRKTCPERPCRESNPTQGTSTCVGRHAVATIRCWPVLIAFACALIECR